MPKIKASTVSYANEKEKEQAISEANQSNARVIDLVNSIGHVVSILYLVLASSDGDISTEEILEMRLKVSEWTGLDQEEAAQIVEETRALYITLVKDQDKILNMLTICISLLDEKMDHTSHKEVLEDLVAIGKADGNFDEAEKAYVEMIATTLGIDEAWVDSLLNN